MSGAGPESNTTSDPAGGQSFYRYEQPGGRLVIVDSLDKVPGHLRSQAERVDLKQGPSGQAGLGGLAPSGAGSGDFNLTSFALGLGAALVCVGIALVCKRVGAGLIAKVLGGAALVALLGGLYLGLLRRSTGQSEELLSSPGAIVEDARRTVEQANEARRKQQRLLDEIGSEK